MIKEFTVGEGAFPVDGEFIPEGTLQDNLYLVNENGTVLASREARPLAVVGTDPFAELGTDLAERRALFRTLAVGADTMYLMQCGPLPLLVMRYLWRGNRTLLCAVPPLPLAKALRTPAAYGGVLLPRELDLSPLSASRTTPPDEEVFRAALEWLSPCRFLRAASEESVARPTDLMPFLKSRTLALARMCGVHALYYYSGIGYATVINVSHPRLVASLAAAMLAMRGAREQTAHFSIERKGDGDPTLTVTFYPEGDLRGIEHLVRGDEHGQNALFENPASRGLYHLRLGFCTPPREATGLRAFDVPK